MRRDVVFLLIGLAAAIPLSIAANLYTPTVGGFLGRRTAKRIGRRRDQIKQELARVTDLHEDAAALHQHMLETILRVVYVAAITAAAAALLSVGGVGSFATILGALIITVLVSRTIADVARVREYADYEQRVKARLAQLDGLQRSPGKPSSK